MPPPIEATLSQCANVLEDIVDLVFQVKAPADFSFRAGQFVTLEVGKNPKGRPIRRSYSIASAPAEAPAVRLILKVLPEGPGSRFLTDIPIGGSIAMTGPYGFFLLEPSHEGDIVMAATGTGVAPVMSMLSELAAQPKTGQRKLLWGLRHETDIFLRAEVESLCRAADTQLHLYLSQSSPEWPGLRGRISEPVISMAKALTAPTFYLVGNGAMIREVKQGLIGQGIDRKKQIRNEAFFD